MAARPAKYTDPRAERIDAWARENKTSLRKLSQKAGLSPSTAQKVCRNLETNESDVGIATLTALAKAMGHDLRWLLYGDAPPDLVLLREANGWDAARREAIEKLGVSPITVETLGDTGWRMLPPQVDGLFIAGLALQVSRPRTT